MPSGSDATSAGMAKSIVRANCENGSRLPPRRATLVASATESNIAALEARDQGNPALPKYAEIGRRFAMQKGLDGPEARHFLVASLRRWEEELELPRLAAYGIGTGDLELSLIHI